MFSLLVGFSTAALVYVAFLQTSVLSKGRLLIALGVWLGMAGANHALLRWRWQERAGALYAHRLRVFALCLLAPFLFLPFLYASPPYPTSPLLRAWSDIAVQFALAPEAQAIDIGTDAVHLAMDKNVLDARSFERIGNWSAPSHGFHLAPGLTASLHWAGPIARTATLTVVMPRAQGVLTVYWDASRLQFDLPREAPAKIVLVRKFATPLGVQVILFLSWCFLLAGLFFVLTPFLETTGLVPRIEHAGKRLLWLLALVLAAVLVWLQVNSLDGGLDYLYTVQMARHQGVLQGTAPDPWQYRLLAEWVAEGALRLFQSLGVPHAVAVGFLSLRVIQNFFIFVLAFGLYRRLTASPPLALMGMFLLAGAMKNAFYDNDLSLNTYFDVLFYLLAAVWILQRRYSWVVPLMLFAALNRETSGLIPAMLFLAVMEDRRPAPRKCFVAALAALVFVVVFVGVRFSFPPRPLYIPYEQKPGFPLLLYNVTRAFTWEQLFHTLGFLPLLSGLFFFALPRLWKSFFLILPPAWFGVHLFLSVVGETRLFLVPQAIVFVPAALLAWRSIQLGSFSGTRRSDLAVAEAP